MTRRLSLRRPRLGARWSVMVAGASLLAAVGFVLVQPLLQAQGTGFVGPTSSQPLALSASGEFLAAVNPDNNSVSFFDLRANANLRVATVPVQVEPNGVALMPNGLKAYVANTVSGTVSVIKLNIANGVVNKPSKHIKVGTEPISLVLTPNGQRLYVANQNSGNISVIDTATDTVIATIGSVAFPRGLAVTNDGDADDLDEKLLVTSFFPILVRGKIDGADDAKVGVVQVFSTATNAFFGDVFVNPLADTGFNAQGDALARIPPGPNKIFPTGAYVNQLNNIAIHNGFAYLPNTGASPNGPVLFDVNTQSLLAAINLTTNSDANLTINMHKAVGLQTDIPKRFITQPWAMAFKHNADEGYVVSAASNIVVKLTIDPATGAPTVVVDPAGGLTRVREIPTGSNPRGIVINTADTRAYVFNYVSRSISVIDLTGATEQVVATMASAALPTPGTLADTIQIGKELYNTSVGVFDPASPGGPVITGRMSNNGWGSCAACHPNGLTDQVVWIFPAGPRRTIPQHADFDPSDPNRLQMRALNWSANRDELEDFESNIRAVSGGQGLIVLADGITPDANVNDFTPLANANRIQLKVRGVNAWDAIKAFVQFGIRAPISPVSKTDPDVVAGRALFTAANCQQCHGGASWTTSRVRFTPPPGAGVVVAGQIIGELRQVGTFDPTAFNEVRQNAAPPLGADGFVPPSLLSSFSFETPAFHNGQAPNFTFVLDNVTHRSAGTAGVDTLANPSDRSKIVAFLRSIDAATAPIP